MMFLQKKIEKRGRKLVDYDSQRHSFQNLQSNATKRRDDVKVTLLLLIYEMCVYNSCKIFFATILELIVLFAEVPN